MAFGRSSGDTKELVAAPIFLNLKNYIALKAKLAVTSAKVPIYTHVYALHTFPLLICNP
jgi:hypothetical protein